MLCLHQYLCGLLDQPRRVGVLTRTLPLQDDHASTTRRERHRENNIVDKNVFIVLHCIINWRHWIIMCSDALNFFRDGLHNCDNNATPVL